MEVKALFEMPFFSELGIFGPIFLERLFSFGRDGWTFFTGDPTPEKCDICLSHMPEEEFTFHHNRHFEDRRFGCK